MPTLKCYLSSLIVIGAWRSLVARFAGGEEVAGSNPVVPTIFSKKKAPPLSSAVLGEFFIKRLEAPFTVSLTSFGVRLPLGEVH